jgi:hypothetical protein
MVGIVSFGKVATPDYPGVYVPESKHIHELIRDRICELSSVPPAHCRTLKPPDRGRIELQTLTCLSSTTAAD